jgi:hypothetical protein
VTAGLAALAIGLAAAGVLSVGTRDTRSSIVALAIVAVVSPVLATGLPGPLALASRLLAGLLATYLLWASVRGTPSTAPSPIGIDAALALAVAAGLAGYFGGVSAPVGGGSTGDGVAPVPEAVACGVALLATGAPALFAGRDALRASVGALLVVHGAWLVRGGLVGSASAAEELALAVLVVALGAGGAALIARARGGSGTLDLGARRAAMDGPRAPEAGEVAAREGRDAGKRGRLPRRRSPSA